MTKKPKKKLKHLLRQMSDVERRMRENTIWLTYPPYGSTPYVPYRLVSQLMNARRRIAHLVREIRKNKGQP